jgi:hypothetical protein
MKKSTFNLMAAIVIGSLTFQSCGTTDSDKSDMQHEGAEMDHEHMDHEEGMYEQSSDMADHIGDFTGDLSPILKSYLSLVNALVNDNSKEAANASKKLEGTLKTFDSSKISEEELKEVTLILDEALVNAKHITKNDTNIEHQREHLVFLSSNMKELIALVGTSQKLYEDYCPMANNNKGASWISDKKEISNPYMGSSMPSCGKINREIN